MTTEQTLKLVEAGFTAEEIRKMESSTNSTEPLLISTPEQKAAEAKAPAAEPAPEKEEPPFEGSYIPKEKKKEAPEEDPIQLAINKAFDERFSKMAESMDQFSAKMFKLAGMPSMEDIKPKGIEDIISNFFKEA